LVRLIELARYAPSGHNFQPVEWKVFLERGRVRELGAIVVDWMRNTIKENPDLAKMLQMERSVARWENGHEVIFRDAPHLLVAHAHKNERTAPQACTLALSYLELAAPSMGLGACWAGYCQAASATWPPMLEALNLPKDHVSYGCMMVGYPSFSYHRLPMRNEPSITWE
jgi:nitroreductase